MGGNQIVCGNDQQRKNMKKILIIHTGGTFGMVPMKPKPTLKPQEVQEAITHYIPELNKIADISFQMVFNIDSADMSPEHWQKLATTIFDNLGSYDGFVIIHGTDSMAYTATALSFMLENLPKPVILTGSQRPLAEIRTDARMNLVNAVEFATREIPEVCIFFDTDLLRGNRAVKISGNDYGAFVSPNYQPLAEVGVDIKIHKQYFHRLGVPRLHTAFSERVLAFPYFPGLQPDALNWLVDAPVDAIVLQALGMGNMAIENTSMVPLVEKLTAAGKLVVITSQCRRGEVDLTRYQNGMLIAKAGAVGAGDMTHEATIVKLMFLLGRYKGNIKKVREAVCSQLAGEISL